MTKQMTCLANCVCNDSGVLFIFQSLYLAVVSTNRARNLYERHGLRVVDEGTCCGCFRCITGEEVILGVLSFTLSFCRVLITFANSLDPDKDRHSVGPDLDPNCLTLSQFS